VVVLHKLNNSHINLAVVSSTSGSLTTLPLGRIGVQDAIPGCSTSTRVQCPSTPTTQLHHQLIPTTHRLDLTA
jgi:hypothetical protein